MYHDYRFRFAEADLPRAAAALDLLRAAGLLAADGMPANMLGGPILLDGKPVAYGLRGRPGSTATGDDGAEIEIPPEGDPGFFYIHIRSDVPPTALPAGFDPAAFGLIPTGAAESAIVLGVWA